MSEEEARDLAERFAAQVYAPHEGVSLSSGYATLRIDMTLMGEDERKLIYEAERALANAGVRFDTNSGGGTRNWELDWSLSGASVNTRPINCSNDKCDVLPAIPLWTAYRTLSERTLRYAYCSEPCQKAGTERLIESGWERLIDL